MPSPPTVCPACALEFSGGETFCPVDGARLMALPGLQLTSDGNDPLLGQTLAGRYRVRRKIGEGGMGIVYEAMHVMIEKPVAIKVLREDFSHREDVVERFRQEAKSASRIGHQHIIDISDFGVTPDGLHFFVMELLQGRDLAEELELRGPLTTRRAVNITLQCAKALEAAHAKGIVHRDIKPENVFLVRRDGGEDFVKIVDFGIAKMSDVGTGRALPGRKNTGSGMIFGTPEYMSPEHAAGRALDHRVDIYALGIILYELLTGRPPFMGDTFMGILTLHMFETAPPLRAAYPNCAAPPELEALVSRAIAKNPDQRPQTMAGFASELAAVLPLIAKSASQPPGTLTYIDQRPLPLPPEHAFSTPPSVGLPPSLAAVPVRGERGLPAWAWLGGALVFVVLVGGGTLVLKRSAADPAVQVASSRVELHVPPSPPSQPTSVVREPKPIVSPLTPREVEVEVVTHPEGAQVSIDGNTRCRSTPCRLASRQGEPMHLQVQLNGYRSSKVDYTPEQDRNQVELVLSPRRSGAPSGARMEGDLMLPDAFGKR